VARVDPDNDDIRRYVVHRYAYDPQRHERRHQVVAAFDNSREFEAPCDREAAELERRRATGINVDRFEHISGTILQPGAKRRAQEQRLIRRAFEHGLSYDPRLQHRRRPACGAVLRPLRRLFSGEGTRIAVPVACPIVRSEAGIRGHSRATRVSHSPVDEPMAGNRCASSQADSAIARPEALTPCVIHLDIFSVRPNFAFVHADPSLVVYVSEGHMLF
jgi:hypothetical protein